MSTPVRTALDDPIREEIKEEAKNFQQTLDRARKILATYYLLLPFVLVYLLFKVFPPQPWPTDPVAKDLLVPTTIYFFQGLIPVVTSLEERLLLLVIVAAALGSYIHSATSYVDYRGNRQFNPSWMLWYLARPLVGVCLALVVYFAVRGGLLLLVVNGSAATEAKNINPFGVAAVAGLTGMFSKQASDKLAEVFSTLFKSQGDEQRKDSLTPGPTPGIKDVDPKQGPEAGETKVTITGTGFATDSKVSFGNNAATNVTFVSATSITADTPAGTGVVDVIITNADGQKATAKQAFTYTKDEGQDAQKERSTQMAEETVNTNAEDEESDFDGCDVEITDETPDEDLPEATGGVA